MLVDLKFAFKTACCRASDPWKCLRQKRKMFSAFGAEFIVEDEPSSVQLYLQRLLTRHDVMITAGAGSRQPPGCPPPRRLLQPAGCVPAGSRPVRVSS